VLSVGRLDRAKRIDLLIEAAAKSGTPVVIAGDGPDRERLESLADGGEVRFAGRVSEEELADLYAGCLAVFYAPVDEDFGMVPYEAFLADKPVVTTTDAGGPLEIVSDGVTGLVCEPRAEELAAAFGRLNPGDAASWGRAGHELAERVTWDTTIERLLAG
jgi:glycosyltransferase involved in cell wall biosynthesis